MRKIALLAHISLDGFVAGSEGELDGFDASEENLEFVCSLTENADTALMGRISYQLLNKYWPDAKDQPKATHAEIVYSNWYHKARKIVVSKNLQESDKNTEIIREDILGKIIQLREQSGKDILIFGSPSLSQLLMQENLIDDYRIFVNPSIFGQGIPLFARLSNRIKLRLLSSRQFANGEIALHYITEK
ncbi:MAG TPA: dihydrofolate reductase family protein [Puia sp.]|nr:dihydrofolate reductase family protein [Puia sp.]